VAVQGYVARVNTEFQKIGTIGTTLLSASGDSGAHGRTNEDCSVCAG
jgi:subtilase family serine protease